MMKSVFILNDLISGGGTEVVLKNIATYLCKKYEVTVMSLDDDYDSFKRIFPKNVKFMPYGLKRNTYSRKNPLHYLIAIHNRLRPWVLRRKHFDIAVAIKEGPCMKLVSRMRADKKLAWIHVDYNYKYWTRSCFSESGELECMRRFDHVVCVSHAALESVKSVIGDPGNLCVRYNPIAYEEIEEGAKEKISIKKDGAKPLFVAIGRLDEQKNYLALVNVCMRLCQEFEFELWIIGDGDQRTLLEETLRKGNCDCVKILGKQNNPYKYLTKADFLVSTAVWESYGLVIQEALILGVPVFTTRCPAIEECFDAGFGILVDCNEESIEQGLRYILENPGCVAEYKKTIAENYDKEELWLRRLEQIEDLMR